MTDFVDLDVRPILKRGGEPFEHIMASVVALKPDQGLRLLATFKPTPLLSVLGLQGLYAQRARDRRWRLGGAVHARANRCGCVCARSGR
ncbi:DUF2249 domain-containing protein [Metallibacterium sp.]